MLVDFNTGFLFLFALIIGALGVTGFIEASQDRQKPYQRYFGLVYIMLAMVLLAVKISSR